MEKKGDLRKRKKKKTVIKGEREEECQAQPHLVRGTLLTPLEARGVRGV